MKKEITEAEYKHTIAVISAMNIPTLRMPLQDDIEDTEPTIAESSSSNIKRISALVGDFLLSTSYLFFKKGKFKKPNFFTWINLGKHTWIFIKSIIKTLKDEKSTSHTITISGTAHRVF